LAALMATRFPRGASRLPGIDDRDVDLAELEGFVVGLADSYLHKAPLRAERIVLSKQLDAAFGGVRQ
jgi:hypothetical protein